MSDAPDDRPRSWVPLAAAAVVGLLVLVGAIVAFAIGGGPDPTQAAVIAACEERQADAGDPAIVAGEVYDPTRWSEHYAVVETHAEVPTPLEELSAEAEAAWEASADVYRETGDGTMVIVWRLEDDTYRQCSASLSEGTVEVDSAVAGPLAVIPRTPAQ